MKDTRSKEGQDHIMKDAQWYKVSFLKSKARRNFQGSIEKGTEGYGAVLNDGSVVLWRGKGLQIDFESIEEAKEYATCLYKVENQCDAILSAWDRVMF